MPREPGTGGWFGTMFRKTGGAAGKAQGGGGCAVSLLAGVAALVAVVARVKGWL